MNKNFGILYLQLVTAQDRAEEFGKQRKSDISIINFIEEKKEDCIPIRLWKGSSVDGCPPEELVNEFLENTLPYLCLLLQSDMDVPATLLESLDAVNFTNLGIHQRGLVDVNQELCLTLLYACDFDIDLAYRVLDNVLASPMARQDPNDPIVKYSRPIDLVRAIHDQSRSIFVPWTIREREVFSKALYL